VRDFVSVRVGTGHARSSHWPMCSGSLSNDHRSSNRPSVADYIVDEPLAGLQVP
jgi:hypothetical protein